MLYDIARKNYELRRNQTGRTSITLFLMKMYIFLFLSKGVATGVRVCEGERDRDGETKTYGGLKGLRYLHTAILTHNFFFWPYHTVFISGPYIFDSFTLWTGATVAQSAWLYLFFSQDWDWLLICGYLCIYDLITPILFQLTYASMSTVYTGALCNHFVYVAGTSSSVNV